MKKLIALFVVMGLGCFTAPFMLAQTLEGNVSHTISISDTRDTMYTFLDTTNGTYLDFSKYNGFHVAVEILTNDSVFTTDSLRVAIQYNRVQNKSDEYWTTLATIVVDEIGDDTLIRFPIDSIIVMDDYMEPWFRAIITLADSLDLDSTDADDSTFFGRTLKYRVNVWLTGFIE